MSVLTQSIPIWVSRKTSDGVIAQFSVSLWIFFLIALLALFNAIAWGCIGLYAASQVVF